MIDSIIVKYLKHNKRITIPEFGTLVRKDSEGIFVLVEFLRRDDGVLAGLLRTEAGLSEQEAAAAIGKYVTDIRERVSSQGSVSLKGIGILSQDNDGLYELDSVKIHHRSKVPVEDRTVCEPAESPKPDDTSREPKVEPCKPTSPAATVKRSITVDENGDPVGDDLFDDDQPKSKGASVADSVASLFAGAKRLASSAAGKTKAPDEKRRKRPAPYAGAEAPDNKKSYTKPDRPAGEAKRFSDLKPRPEIRGLRYKSSDGYPKRKSIMDKVMIFAIIAAVIAIIVMLYGQFGSKNYKPEPLIDDTQTEAVDIQPADAVME